MLAAIYALSLTVGGSIGNPISGVLIERRGFSAFGWVETALIAFAALLATLFMVYLGDRTAEPASCAPSGPGARHDPADEGATVDGDALLADHFLRYAHRSHPAADFHLSGSKVVVAAYGTTNLIVASTAQLLAGRSADRWGARGPTFAAYACVVFAALGLTAAVEMVWGLFVFGVLGVAAAWSLSALMYVWVADGVSKAEHASSFGLLHAVWSLSMITGSLLGGSLVRMLPGPALPGGRSAQHRLPLPGARILRPDSRERCVFVASPKLRAYPKTLQPVILSRSAELHDEACRRVAGACAKPHRSADQDAQLGFRIGPYGAGPVGFLGSREARPLVQQAPHDARSPQARGRLCRPGMIGDRISG